MMWGCSHYFYIEVNPRIQSECRKIRTKKKLYLSVRIWTIFTQWLYLPQIQVEPRGRKLHEAVLTLSLKYEDVQIPLIKETLISMLNLENKMSSILKFNNIYFTEASFFTKSLHYVFQWRIKYRFHYSKQMKLEIPMGNLKLTRIEPIFLLCFILLHICTHNNIGRMFYRS